VQRAVLATKGIVLIVSSTLAYFLARALSRQLIKAAAGIPLLLAIADASSAAAQFIAKLKQQQPAETLAVAAQQRATNVQPTSSSSLQQLRQPDRRPGAGTLVGSRHLQNSFDAMKTYTSRPLNTSVMNASILVADCARSTVAEAHSVTADPELGSAESRTYQDVAVPLFPNAQTAMLSAADPQSAQRRGSGGIKSRAQSMQAPAGPSSRLAGSTASLSANRDAGRQSQSKSVTGTGGSSEQLESLQLSESAKGTGRDREAASIPGGKQGVLWKRNLGDIALSGKWVDSREASVVHSAGGGNTVTGDIAISDMHSNRTQTESVSSEQQTGVNMTPTSKSDTSAAVWEGTPTLNMVDGEPSDLRHRVTGLGATLPQHARVYNGARPENKQGAYPISRTSADGSESAGSAKVLKFVSVGSDGQRAVEKTAKPLDSGSQSAREDGNRHNDDPWFL
jgi:hypothetical protein